MKRRTAALISAVFTILVLSAPVASSLQAKNLLQKKIVRELEFSSGGKLSINNPIGKVDIRGWDRDEVRIVAVKIVRNISDESEARDILQEIKIKISEHEGSIDIYTEIPEFSGNNGNNGIDGWRFIAGLFSWPPRVETRSLPVEVRYSINLPRNTDVKIDTEVGNIDVRQVAGGIQAESAVGTIRMTAIEGPIKAHSDIGKIIIQDIIADVEAHSEIGKVVLGVNPAVPVHLDITTTIGTIDIDADLYITGNLSKRRIIGTTGENAGPRVRVSTEIGKVEITTHDNLFPDETQELGYNIEPMPNQDTPACDNIADEKECGARRITNAWRSDCTLGLMLSQKRNKFSKWDPVLAYQANTMWRRTESSRIHSFFGVALTRVPQVLEIASPGSAPEQLKIVRRTMKADLGWYWARDIAAGRRDVLSIGPIISVGLESYAAQDEMSAGGDGLRVSSSNNYYLNGGLRFSQYRKRSSWINPEELRTVEILVARYSGFHLTGATGDGITGSESRGRLLVNAHSRLTDGIYIGFLTNFPLDFDTSLVAGEPDLRMLLALKW